MRAIVLITLWLNCHNVFSQNKLSFGIDFGKSMSINSLLFSKQALKSRTHFFRYYPKGYNEEFMQRFTNILNFGAVLNYQLFPKTFFRIRYTKSINWAIVSHFDSNLDLIFPGSIFHYSQANSCFSGSYHKVYKRKNQNISIGIGAHLIKYKKDSEGKELHNFPHESTRISSYNEGDDSAICITSREIIIKNGGIIPILGINLNIEYSISLLNAGKLSFYSNCNLNFTKSNLWFKVTHQVRKYDRASGFIKEIFPDEEHNRRFTYNPLQFGIIYYLPPFQINKKINKL